MMCLMVIGSGGGSSLVLSCTVLLSCLLLSFIAGGSSGSGWMHDGWDGQGRAGIISPVYLPPIHIALSS